MSVVPIVFARRALFRALPCRRARSGPSQSRSLYPLSW
jgi:hypothetical protein